MMSPEEKDTSDDEWDELLFEIDEESYWNKKLGKLLIITQIPLHLKVTLCVWHVDICLYFQLRPYILCVTHRHELIN